jgi:tetratricopeptide (TPR) repeat protein
MRAGTFGSSAARGWSGGQFSHAGAGNLGTRNFGFNGTNHWNPHQGNWYGHNGSWYGRHDWDDYFGHGGWGWGGYGLGLLGWSWGYPYDYGYYDPSYAYYSYYPSNEYYYSYAPIDDGAANVEASPAIAAPQALPPPAADQDQQGAGEGAQYYSEARAAFLEGDYRNTLRLAGHAGVESPRNPRVHELISLALFALGDYPAAASEAHAAMAMGPIADWRSLYAHYNDADKYTAQLRALESASSNNPKAAADHFLLGYQYLMIGARDNAKAEFQVAVKLTPNDKLASHFLQQLQSNSPITPPQMASKPQMQSR